MDDTSIPEERAAQKKEARRLANKAWQAAHPGYASRKSKAWREHHPEEYKAYDLHYKETHRAERCLYTRLYEKNHPAQVAAAKKRWDARNKQLLRARRQARYLRNAAEDLIYLQTWRKKNPEKVRAMLARRRAARRNAPVNDFTAQEWRALCRAVGYCCVYCGQKFPFKQLTQDHITPLAQGGSHTLSNILPACLSCNCSKQDRDVPSPVQPFLLLEV